MYSYKTHNSTYRQEDPLVQKLQAIGLHPKKKEEEDDNDQRPRASILVPFFYSTIHQEWYILLTQRPLHLKSHAGEVCFPGGKQEAQDQGDDIVTALRETYEEVGIPSAWMAACVGRLATIESVGGLCVTPIVAILSREDIDPCVDLKLCPTEVEAAFAVPIAYFWNEENCHSQEQFEWRGSVFDMRYYYYKDPTRSNQSNATDKHNATFKIWGLTAHVAYQVAQLCKPDDGAPAPSPSPLQGPLLRWMDPGNGGKPYWAQRYYVLQRSNNNNKNNSNSNCSAQAVVLHQYDNEQKARQKSESATKKNRLHITKNCGISAVLVPSNDDDNTVPPQLDGKKCHAFTITTLNGRIEWKLAATSKANQENWMSTLSLIIEGA